MKKINKISNKVKNNKESKVMSILKNKKVFKTRLEKRYKSDLNEFSDSIENNRTDYVKSCLWKQPNRQDIENYIKDFDPSWEVEDTAWEAWYLRGIDVSINEINNMWNKFNSIPISEEVDKIDKVIQKKTIEELASLYTNKFLNEEINDVETIYNFLDKLITQEYFWIGEEVALIWNRPEIGTDWVERSTFDVFYNNQISDRSYYTSVEYIEWLNEEEGETSITSELIGIADRIEDHINFLKKNVI